MYGWVETQVDNILMGHDGINNSTITSSALVAMGNKLSTNIWAWSDIRLHYKTSTHEKNMYKINNSLTRKK